MSGPPGGRRDGAAAVGAARALAIGIGWAVLVVALLLLANAGRSFIYQGF